MLNVKERPESQILSWSWYKAFQFMKNLCGGGGCLLLIKEVGLQTCPH